MSPTVQADLCGTGVGVLGTGSTSDCNATQTAVGGGAGGLLGINPNVQLGVCGNGVGMLGAGTTATCSGSSSSGPGSAAAATAATVARATTVARAPTVAPAPTVAAAARCWATRSGWPACPRALAQGILPSPAAAPSLTALVGLGLAVAGGVVLRLRRFGYRA